MDRKSGHQRPEGALVEKRLQGLGISIRKAAQVVGLSEGRLRHIVNGYQSFGGGQMVDVVAPADTLARIFRSFDLDAEAATRVGRSDVAEALRQVAPHLTTDAADMFTLWAKDRSGDPPKDALGLFSDQQIVDEVARRFAR